MKSVVFRWLGSKPTSPFRMRTTQKGLIDHVLIVPLHRLPFCTIDDWGKVLKIIYVILSCLSVEHFTEKVY